MGAREQADSVGHIFSVELPTACLSAAKRAASVSRRWSLHRWNQHRRRAILFTSRNHRADGDHEATAPSCRPAGGSNETLALGCRGRWHRLCVDVAVVGQGRLVRAEQARAGCLCSTCLIGAGRDFHLVHGLGGLPAGPDWTATRNSPHVLRWNWHLADHEGAWRIESLRCRSVLVVADWPVALLRVG